MKIGIYLGDIKKPSSIGDLTFEMSFINELLGKENRHEFIVYYIGEKNIFKDGKNVKFKRLLHFKKPTMTLFPFNVKLYRTSIFSLNNILKKDRVNVAFFLVPYLKEHIEIPYFAAIRDVAHRILPHFPEFSTNSVFEKMEKKLNSFLTGASKIITCNNIAKNDIKTLYDVIEENIITISLPYPKWVEETLTDNEEDVLRKYNLSKKSYIFYPAQFWTHKNHIRLVLMAQVLKEQNINLKVVFTGLDRGNLEYIKNSINNLDLNDDIMILDFVNRKELATLYKNAYCTVYPSLAGPDSIVALEAIYFNCPLLISNHLGYNEQLKNAALYFNPLDENDIVEKIKMLNNIQIKDEIEHNCRLLIKEASTKHYMEKFINIMDDFYSTRMCWSLNESYKDKV